MDGIKLSLQHLADTIGPDIFDSSACRRLLIKHTRGDVPECPSCGSRLSGTHLQRLIDGKSITCHCGVMSSPRSGTILEGSTLTDRQIVFIITMIFWDFPASKIASLAGCTRATVYNWRNRIQDV